MAEAVLERLSVAGSCAAAGVAGMSVEHKATVRATMAVAAFRPIDRMGTPSASVPTTVAAGSRAQLPARYHSQ
ncbi:hypothetical protein GALLR39Z86_37900 [Glycomyces algeriensis]|uniref:Uncharacterized protein n=1 Tax=Glycomyces algeriensis TaxID=256037 RepID=A0A9W6G9T0_9ACTN|nr:hypothetical protein GALLR39Z86_37900 [Glycomyces algeriensis]